MRIGLLFPSLFSRLLLALLGLLILFALFSLWVTHKSSQSYFYEFNQRIYAPIAMYMANNYGLISHGKIDYKQLDELSEHLMNVNPGIEVFILDLDGNVMAQTASANTIARRSVSLDPIHRFLQSANDADSDNSARIAKITAPQYPLYGDNPRGDGLKSVFSAHPLHDESRIAGYVYAVLAGPVQQKLNESMMFGYSVRRAALTTLGVLAFTVLGGAILFSILTRRLTSLSRRVEQWRKYSRKLEENDTFSDDLVVKEPSQSNPNAEISRNASRNGVDEIDRLATSYESMTIRLSEQLLELKRADNNRRDLFASISHDLRTPLTSMQGYIETINHQYGELDDKHKQRYLSIALKQCGRLRRLIDDVLELSKLNSGELKLYCEKFNMLELVHDNVQDFALKARQKKISMHVLPTSSTDSRLSVYADLALVHRVLENLLSNAFRFTPPGGKIFVSVHRKNQSAVLVSVVDTGVGMSVEEAEQAFDSQYTRSSSSKTNRKHHHSGLGLALAKAVVELHGGKIKLLSKAGKGANFEFTLPSALTIEEQPSKEVELQY